MIKKVSLVFASVVLLSCGKEATPKPFGELRLEYPAPKYQKMDKNCNYSFEYSIK